MIFHKDSISTERRRILLEGTNLGVQAGDEHHQGVGNCEIEGRNTAAILFLDHVFYSVRGGDWSCRSIDAGSVLRERLIFLRSSYLSVSLSSCFTSTGSVHQSCQRRDRLQLQSRNTGRDIGNSKIWYTRNFLLSKINYSNIS